MVECYDKMSVGFGFGLRDVGWPPPQDQSQRGNGQGQPRCGQSVWATPPLGGMDGPWLPRSGYSDKDRAPRTGPSLAYPHMLRVGYTVVQPPTSRPPKG